MKVVVAESRVARQSERGHEFGCALRAVPQLGEQPRHLVACLIASPIRSAKSRTVEVIVYGGVMVMSAVRRL